VRGRSQRLFDGVRATEREILSRATSLEGMTLAQLGTGHDLTQPSSMHNKAAAGHALEAFFGLKRNSDPRPDFVAASLELKSTGLRIRADGSVGQKERIALRMMGKFVPEELWETSALRHKLDRLLIVFFGYVDDAPIGSFRILKVVRWSPDADELALLEADWQVIRKVRLAGGRLSESQTNVLAASTKGPGRSTKESRGFSLKPRFVHSIYAAAIGALDLPSIQDNFSPGGPFESEALASLHRFVGRNLSDVALEFGLPSSIAKNAQASVVRSILGLPARRKTKEFERFGLEVKTVPMLTSGRVLEAMSFPAFRLVDLVGEVWEESDLLSDLTRLLVVPLVRVSESSPREDAWVGRAFFWSPGSQLVADIRTVWEAYRDRVEKGHPELYPRRRDGLPIFVNTHSQNSLDRDPGAASIAFTKRSFWLHPAIVRDAVEMSHPAWRGY
jgi:DNA mismatch repair protein MutH